MKPYRIKPKRKGMAESHAEAAKISKKKREAILKRALRGYRIELGEVGDKLTPYSKKLWLNQLPTPTGKQNRRLPSFMAA